MTLEKTSALSTSRSSSTESLQEVPQTVCNRIYVDGKLVVSQEEELSSRKPPAEGHLANMGGSAASDASVFTSGPPVLPPLGRLTRIVNFLQQCIRAENLPCHDTLANARRRDYVELEQTLKRLDIPIPQIARDSGYFPEMVRYWEMAIRYRDRTGHEYPGGALMEEIGTLDTMPDDMLKEYLHATEDLGVTTPPARKPAMQDNRKTSRIASIQELARVGPSLDKRLDTLRLIGETLGGPSNH